jgi:hypothetical protein
VHGFVSFRKSSGSFLVSAGESQPNSNRPQKTAEVISQGIAMLMASVVGVRTATRTAAMKKRAT